MSRFNNIKEIFERMKSVAKVKTDTELAEILGLSHPASLSSSKKKKTFPSDHIIDFANKYKVDVGYLLHGDKRAIDEELRNLIDLIKDDHETIEILKTIVELRKKIKDALIKLTVEVVEPKGGNGKKR